MARTNVHTSESHVYDEARTAGGFGVQAAKQSELMQLRRCVLACLLWEDNAYCDGQTVVDTIKKLIPNVPAADVAALAVEARFEQKLRHVPLLLVREMARHATHKHLVAQTLEKVIHRPDELSEFLSLYWKDNDGKKTISAQVKKGLAAAFKKFNEYQLAKWNRDNSIKLRDVLFLCHAKPVESSGKNTKVERSQQVVQENSTESEILYRKLVSGELAVPDTWEVGLSAAKSVEEKRAVWEELISINKLGALAFLKNLRNMQEVGVSAKLIRSGFEQIKPDMLLPIDFLRARTFAKDYSRELESLMLKCASSWPKLKGHSIFVVDVSGSMGTRLSGKTDFTRMSAAAAMTVLAAEMCESVTIYVTAGNDGSRVHKTQKVEALRGFALADKITDSAREMGGGGIFTRKCINYIKEQEKEQPDRIIVFSDSQDCDKPGSGKPSPNGVRNYIVDVSSQQHGVNYAGVWTVELSGWSEHFLRFIAESEK